MIAELAQEQEQRQEHDLIEVSDDGKMQLYFHPGQWRAWSSQKRFVCVLAGTQSGKTSFGPLWLWREIQLRGPGDYMVVTPTFPLLELKALPEFRRTFEHLLRLGKYLGGPVRKFVFSPEGEVKAFGAKQSTPTTVYFGHAQDPDSLESATAKAAWLDEAGQKKFKLGSFEAIQRRLSLHLGRLLVTTTPYDLGWLKQKLFDPWLAHDRNHPDIDVISFDSTQNPAFPQAEFERARRDLPAWKFDLFYRAIFTRPAGLIYDSFNDLRHKIPRFSIPDKWPRFLGLDFGGVHTAGMFYAEDPATRGKYNPNSKYGQLYAYREYLAGGRTSAEHVTHILKGEPALTMCVGGSRSEGQWRNEFKAGGLTVLAPEFSEVEVGIDRVYGAHKRDQILVFSDLDGYLEQKQTYSRILDERGEPTEGIEDKETFHFLDAERYIIGRLVGGKSRAPISFS
jgi:hypothetical protein